MTYRITNAHLEGKVATVNRMLGHAEDAPFSTPGVVVLAGAYGGTGVHQYSNESGGVRSLLGYVTKREAAYFLDGMIQALRAVKE